MLTSLRSWYRSVILMLLFGSVLIASSISTFAQSGAAISSATVSDATLNVGDLIGVDSSIDVTAAPSQTFAVRVNQGSDDAEERISDGSIDLTSTDLELIHDSRSDGSEYDQVVGIRFQNVDIPVKATIKSAYIEFETDEPSSEATSLMVYGQAVDNPTTFEVSDNNISNRVRTAASVAWNPGVWNTVNEKHQTDDLAAIVQELVNRGGWAGGNGMVFIIEGSGRRVAESYNGESANAPLLVIEYYESVSELTINSVGQGDITLDPEGGTYDEGTVVELTAVPDDGWHFDSWSDDLSGATNPQFITMDGDKTVTAHFVQNSTSLFLPNISCSRPNHQ